MANEPALAHDHDHGTVEHSAVGHGGHPVDDSGAPEKWGMHAEWGKWARRSGWVVVVLLVLNVFVTHYNGAGFVALLGTAAIIVVLLLRDHQQRRNAWRK